MKAWLQAESPMSDEGTLGRPPLGGVRPKKQGLPSLS
jgi:hypothetical protein